MLIIPARAIWALLPFLALLFVPTLSSNAALSATTQWEQQAKRITITRDDWGIAHIYGKTDADAVFGMIYAQAEDDFNRIETNYLVNLGRLAEAEGEKAIWQDLRARLYMQPDDLKARYASSPDWLKRLMNAWADGLNYYLAMHPDVRPKVIKHFEPWMTLAFSEGSIGGDIERISLDGLQAFYSTRYSTSQATTLAAYQPLPEDQEPRGSNGFAIAPANTANGKALLLINPHTSFFFRSELQMQSDEGLNAYGAVTWGQFFVYQGFNEHAGWMHTSSGADVTDEFTETIVNKNGRLYYLYGKEERPVATSAIHISYRAADGSIAARTFTLYHTHHGPIVREQDGKWISFAMMHKPVEALSQSFLRTKAQDYATFMKVMELKANSSNNTIFADAKGHIAYLHPQFIPRRNDHLDYTKPVDGSDPATDWKSLHALGEAPHLLNPANGWIMNTNNWPYSAAGENSPRREDYPRYMDTAGENPRGIHARLVLDNRKDFTIETLRAAAYDSYLPAFAQLIPELIKAWDHATANPLKARLSGQIEALRNWDYRWNVASIPTSLAVFWGEALFDQASKGKWQSGLDSYQLMANAPASQKLEALDAASDRLQQDFGSWRIPWGEINRFQRLNGDIIQPFTDAKASIPVGFPSARWGSLASFGARRYEGTKRYYGTSGNSFVAIVEFGEKVRARAVTAGGESDDPRSPHFNDQAERYATGNLRDVYFYPEDVRQHMERSYRPGAR